MVTDLLLVIAILIVLLIFWPAVFRFFFITFFSGDKLQLIVTKIQQTEIRGKRSPGQINLHIKIKNSGRNEIEIQAPVLEFVRGKNTRKFQPKIVEDTIYPLILNPKTHHEFNIDLYKILQAKPELKKFKAVRIIFTDRENKNTVVKSVHIH